MTFEQWMLRPVYVVQVYTTSIQRQLGFSYNYRRLPAYRNPVDTETRRMLAIELRHRRRNGLTRRMVKQVATEIINSDTGVATPLDIALA